MTTRTARLAGAVLAGGIGLLTLTGCGESLSCGPTSCTVTLDGAGAQVEVLNTTIRLGSVEDGRATIGVGEVSVSCAEGERVSAAGLSLECTTVSTEEVQLTASLG